MEAWITEIRNNVRLILQKLNNLPSSSNSDGATIERLQYQIIDLQKQLEERNKEFDRLYAFCDKMGAAMERHNNRINSVAKAVGAEIE